MRNMFSDGEGGWELTKRELCIVRRGCCLTVHQHGLTVTDYHTTSEVGQPTQAVSDVTDNNKQRQQKIITETQN